MQRFLRITLIVMSLMLSGCSVTFTFPDRSAAPAATHQTLVETATKIPTNTPTVTAIPSASATPTPTATSTLAPTPTVVAIVSTPTPQRYLEGYYFAIEGPMGGQVVGPVKYYGRNTCEPLMMYNMPGETKQYSAIVRSCKWKTE